MFLPAWGWSTSKLRAPCDARLVDRIMLSIERLAVVPASARCFLLVDFGFAISAQ